MDPNFTTISPWNVKSDDGFTVEIAPNGVIFAQGSIMVEIPYEWLMNNGIGLFPSSGACKGLVGLPSDVVSEMMGKIQLALNFMGFKVEFFDY